MILKILDRTSCEQLKDLGYDSLKMISSGKYGNQEFALYGPSSPYDKQTPIPIDEIKYETGKVLYVCM